VADAHSVRDRPRGHMVGHWLEASDCRHGVSPDSGKGISPLSTAIEQTSNR
jgi:hypothetical protein